MNSKVCSKCGIEKPINEYSFKNKSLNIHHGECKDCTRLLIKNHYNKNKEYYLGKAQKRNNNLRLEVLDYINQYLQKNPCIDCGETDIVVLEFDHKRDQFVKFRAVSSLVRARFTLEKVKEEIKKCEVRCANCHRRKTAKEFNWLKNNNALVA